MQLTILALLTLTAILTIYAAGQIKNTQMLYLTGIILMLAGSIILVDGQVTMQNGFNETQSHTYKTIDNNTVLDTKTVQRTPETKVIGSSYPFDLSATIGIIYFAFALYFFYYATAKKR